MVNKQQSFVNGHRKELPNFVVLYTMKIVVIRKRFIFYIWVGLAFMGLWLLHDLSNYPETFGLRVLNNIWRTVYIIPVNYILFEHSWPFIRRNWKTVFFPFLLILAHLMIYSWSLYAWRFLGIQLHMYTSLVTYPNLEHAVEAQMAFSAASFFFFGVIRHIDNYRRLMIAAQQLRIEKQAAELNYLKSQTNPHFLFNTLNNIYSLSRDKSDLAPEAIMRLSKILRFMLYETSGEYIAIEQELKILDDYIALEKLRYDESLRVNFNYHVEDMRQSLPPLLLIPLVENAFKHGVSETRNHPFVDIHLSCSSKELKFVVKNSSEKLSGDGGVKENIGLNNLRRQLKLLYKEYELEMKQRDGVFTAVLKIDLISHQ